jgi:hypothetical protein
VAIRERIPQRAPDPARREMLFELAERLNAEAWTDADQVTAGLQQAGEALERLSQVFAKRRRRPKKRASAAGSGPPEAATAAAATAPDDLSSPADGGEDDESDGAEDDPSDPIPDA